VEAVMVVAVATVKGVATVMVVVTVVVTAVANAGSSIAPFKPLM
jgi:hypothetical protein